MEENSATLSRKKITPLFITIYSFFADAFLLMGFWA